jgi:uncharacterized RDD family membrane protein YckC
LSTSSSLRSDSPAVVPSWKQEVNEKLAAHRTRHSRKAEEQTSLPLDLDSQDSRSAQVAARVAARYAKAPSYSELLAKEAHAAARVAEAAVLEARAAAQAVLESIEMAAAEAATPPTPTPAPRKRPSPTAAAPAVQPASASVALPEKPTAPVSERRHETAEPTPAYSTAGNYAADLFEDAVVEPVESIAGNLIQFPREIVAPRRARPRLAEGPLREEADASETPQLRIFEVDTESISQTPGVEHAMPEWSSIRLDAREAQPSEEHPQLTNYLDVPMNTASISDRLMAALVDLSLAGLAFLVFVLVFVACTTHPPTGKAALAAAGGTLVFFLLLYQYLFFTYSEGTPGMRYARIALCTFEDENPTRRQMRNRIGGLVLSACTLGMGFAWVFFDEDHLGWHDRLSRTYQRSYR